jgi:hypothetical protein
MRTQLALSLSLASAIFALGFLVPPVFASQVKIDESILKIVNEAVMNMQRDTMTATYAAMPLKDQMRGKMMVQNASGNLMQSAIQPQMMQKNMEANMGAMKLRLMNLMSQM